MVQTMLTTYFLLAFIFGCGLAATAFVVSHWSDGELAKAFTDFLFKLAVMVFGVSIGLFGFFGQKWLEDKNTQIDQAREALGNLDIVNTQYNLETEHAYYLNSPGFNDLREQCKAEIEISSKDRHYCSSSIKARSSVTNSVVMSASDYFDFNPPAKFYDGFTAKIYEQTYLKRVASSRNISDLFNNYAEMDERYGIMVARINALKDAEKAVESQLAGLEAGPPTSVAPSKKTVNFEPPRLRKLRSNLAPDDKDSAKITNDGVLIYAHDVCCTVQLLSEESGKIATMAQSQATAFCSIRSDIRASLDQSIDPIVKALARSRLDEIYQRIDQSMQSKDSCKFVPRTDVTE